MKVAGAIFHRNTMAGGKSHVYRLVYGYCAAAVSDIVGSDFGPCHPLSAAGAPHAGGVGAAEPAERQRRAADPLGEHHWPESCGGCGAELSQHLPAARNSVPGG